MTSARLTLAFGAFLPEPAPAALLEQVESVSVRHSDTGRSGFQISLRSVRDRQSGMNDHLVFARRWLEPGHRVWIGVDLGAQHIHLMDGLVTNRQVSVGDASGATIGINGEDVSWAMDLVDISFPFPGPDVALVALLLAPFAAYGVVPLVIPPLSDFAKNPVETVPTVQGTPFSIIRSKADEAGYVFYVDPGPTPGMNLGYFGPRIRAGIPQRALTVDMSGATNVRSISFTQDANRPALVFGSVQDSSPYATIPYIPVPPLPTVNQPLSAEPATYANVPWVHYRLLKPDDRTSAIRAYARALAETSKSGEDAVTASGEVDVARYGTVLKARTIVGLRGAGTRFDGHWYVQSVSHTLKRGEYRQSFSLQRDGLGTLVSTVQT